MVCGVTDDPGVMGNLPRSRPGRRSEKRASEVKPASSRAQGSGTGAKSSAPRAKGTGTRSKASGTRAKASGTRAKASGTRAKASTTGATSPPTAARDERTEAPKGQDPITATLRLGMAVGDAGVKTLAKIVQRLPRP